MKLTFNEHIFTNARNGIVTIVSLESPVIFRLQGPLADCWWMVRAGKDFLSIAETLGAPQASLEELSMVLASYGFVTEPVSPAMRPLEAGPWMWSGLGTLTQEVLNEELIEAYASISFSGSPGGKQEGP
jgi:hypothetical protein